MVTQTLGPDREETADEILDVQQSLNDFILTEEEKHEKDEPLLLTPKEIGEILTDGGISEEKARKKSKKIMRNFFRILSLMPKNFWMPKRSKTTKYV